MSYEIRHQNLRGARRGPWRLAGCAALLLAITGCFEPQTLAVPGHERVVHGSYAGTLEPWPNDSGRLEFLLEAQAEYESESRYAFTGVMTLQGGSQHAVSGTVYSLGRVRFQPSAHGSLGPLAPPPIRYALFAHVPSLSLGLCAEEALDRPDWTGVAMVTATVRGPSNQCTDQFYLSLGRVPAGT